MMIVTSTPERVKTMMEILTVDALFDRKQRET